MPGCLETIAKRRSVRWFTTEEVSREQIEQLIESANLAPSAGNLQARDFVVVTNKFVKQKLAQAALAQLFIKEASVVIVACANVPRSARVYRGQGEFYSICDTSAAIMNLLLAAESVGLGACWIGAFNEEEVVSLLQLPDSIRPVAIIPVGFPSQENQPQPTRLDPEIITHWEMW